MGALVQLSGREAGCLFFCSPFITPMKTLIICIPPELSSAGELKSFCGGSPRRSGASGSPGAPGAAQRGSGGTAPSPGRRPHRRRGTSARGAERSSATKQDRNPCGKHAPSARIFSAFTLFLVGLSFRAASRALEVSHVTVVRWCTGLGLRRIPVDAGGG